MGVGNMAMCTFRMITLETDVTLPSTCANRGYLVLLSLSFVVPSRGGLKALSSSYNFLYCPLRGEKDYKMKKTLLLPNRQCS